MSLTVREEALACLETSPSILVAGDVMLEHETRLGGIGNVVANLFSQGAIVSSLCFIGTDGDAATIRKRLAEKCRLVHEIPTPRGSSALTGDEEREALRVLSGVDFGQLRAAIISDHDNGFCSSLLCRKIIERAALAGITTFVKPGKTGWDKYRLATVACCDLNELSIAFGKEIPNDDSHVEQAGRELLSRLEIATLAVIRGRKGLSIMRSAETSHHEGVMPREGGSATEAEAVISVAARLTASGLGVHAALSIAAEATSLAGLEPNASIVKLADTIKAISKVDLGEEGRRITWSYAEAGRVAAQLKRDSRKVVFTNGCFDVLHPGHLSLLRRARALGGYLIVGLNDDASVRRLKGPARPVNDERTRAVLLSGLRFVDLVAVFTEDTPTELLRAVQPDILVKGSEYRLEEIPGREFAAETVLLGMVPGFSSTASIKNIKAK